MTSRIPSDGRIRRARSKAGEGYAVLIYVTSPRTMHTCAPLLFAHMLVLFPPVLLLARLGAIPHALAAAAPLERRGVGAGFGLAAVGTYSTCNYLRLNRALALPTTDRGIRCGG